MKMQEIGCNTTTNLFLMQIYFLKYSLYICRELKQNIMKKLNYSRITKLQKDSGFSEMQDLINSGTAWKMEGSIGRKAMECLRLGACMLPKKTFKDCYGNTIPSREDLKEGTQGTFQNSVNYYTNY